MKSHYLFLLVLVLSVLASCKKQPGGIERIVSGLEPGQVKVMSYNIRGYTNEDDHRNNWAMRAGATRDMLIDQKPSIVGIQELSETTEYPYIRDVMGPRGYANLSSDDTSNSIIYLEDELEVLQTDVFWQSNTPERKSTCWDGYERIVRWAVFRIKVTGARFFFVDSHLGLTAEARQKGVSLIRQKIKLYNEDNLPVMFTADCNTGQDDKIFAPITDDMVNARSVAPVTDSLNTYNSWGKEGKAAVIDHIWLSNSIPCSIYKTVTDKYDGHKYVSDHYPIYAIVKF